jgi:hypothetical protein
VVVVAVVVVFALLLLLVVTPVLSGIVTFASATNIAMVNATTTIDISALQMEHRDQILIWRTVFS